MKTDNFVIQSKRTPVECGAAFLNSPCGTLKVWCDEDGMYVDLVDSKDGDICIISMHPDADGMDAYIYGDPESGIESMYHRFYDIKRRKKEIDLS